MPTGRQKKTLLTPRIKKSRLEWARERQNWTRDDWQKVIFSDESKFNLEFSDGKTTVRRRPGERLKEECVAARPKRSKGVMVWGIITAGGVGTLLIVDGSINAVKYKEVIENGVVPTIEEVSQYYTGVVFQDDSAPCHRAKTVSKP